MRYSKTWWSACRVNFLKVRMTPTRMVLEMRSSMSGEECYTAWKCRHAGREGGREGGKEGGKEGRKEGGREGGKEGGREGRRERRGRGREGGKE